MAWWPFHIHRRESAGSDQARAELERLEAQRPEVERLAEAGRRQQARNHFGEGIEKAMRRRYAS